MHDPQALPADPEDAAPEDAAPEDAAPEDAAPEDAGPWDAGWTYGRSVQIAVVDWLLLGITWIAVLRRRSPQLFTRRSQVLDSGDPGNPGAAAGELAGMDA